MYQSIITFSCQAFDSAETLRPVFSLLRTWEFFEPVDYDLNQMESWRAWDSERAFVDALTQRTQLFRVRGKDEAIAMIAMGKHGEPPTLVVQFDAPSDRDATRQWSDLDQHLIAGARLLRDGQEIASR